MLMIRAHHDVSAVERVPLWVVITECVVGREHIPRIINVKVFEHQPQREVHAGNSCTRTSGRCVFRNHLPLREARHVFAQLSVRVRRLCRIDTCADFSDRIEIRFEHRSEPIVRRKHILKVGGDGGGSAGLHSSIKTNQYPSEPNQSGRPDSNRRLPAPKAGALPS